MFVQRIDPSWKDQSKRLSQLNQGDVIEGLPIGYFSQGSIRACVDSPEQSADVTGVQISDLATHAIIVTQSCDLIEEGDEPTRPLFLVAPVYQLADPTPQQKLDIEVFRSHNLVRLTGPHFQSGFWVADLRALTSFDKGVLIDRTVNAGFATEDDRRRFAEHVSWQFGRPDFPQAINDYVVAHLRRWIYKKPQRSSKMKDLGVDELRLTVSSPHVPCSATLWALVEDPMLVANVQEFFDAWYISAAKEARAAGITLTFKVDFIDHLNAREYRTAHAVSLR